MESTNTRTFDRIPHTNRQLARGTIGLVVGGIVAVLTGLLIYLLNAPDWVNGGLGVLLVFSLGVAVLAPSWYWIVEPYVRDTGDD